MVSETGWFQPVDKGVQLHLQVTPNGSRNMIEAPAARDDGQLRLRIKVRAVAAENAANQAVCVLLAKWLGVPKTRISMIRGHTSRQKTALVETDDRATFVAQLEALATGLQAASFTAR